MKLKKFILFLKWFLGYRGSTKVLPSHAFRYLPSINGINPQLAEIIVESKLSSRYTELTCAECGCTYWSTRKKNPSPVCTVLKCYMDYWSRRV